MKFYQGDVDEQGMFNAGVIRSTNTDTRSYRLNCQLSTVFTLTDGSKSQ